MPDRVIRERFNLSYVHRSKILRVEGHLAGTSGRDRVARVDGIRLERAKGSLSVGVRVRFLAGKVRSPG